MAKDGNHLAPQICDVEDLCHAFSQPLSQQDIVQAKIERVLDYLVEWNVIDRYNADALDWIFGNEQCN